METLDYRFDGTTPVRFPTDAVLVGVLASGHLEILLEPADLDGAMTVRIITAARGFGTVWQAVIADFAQRHPLQKEPTPNQTSREGLKNYFFRSQTVSKHRYKYGAFAAVYSQK